MWPGDQNWQRKPDQLTVRQRGAQWHDRRSGHRTIDGPVFGSTSYLGLYVGAGDENRTRTISLGSGAITAASGTDLHVQVSASGRGYLLVTLANGPLMAQRSLTDLTGLPSARQAWRQQPRTASPCDGISGIERYPSSTGCAGSN
jgi:hypothetical protein